MSFRIYLGVGFGVLGFGFGICHAYELGTFYLVIAAVVLAHKAATRRDQP
jgi:hypothetical protein